MGLRVGSGRVMTRATFPAGGWSAFRYCEINRAARVTSCPAARFRRDLPERGVGEQTTSSGCSPTVPERPFSVTFSDGIPARAIRSLWSRQGSGEPSGEVSACRQSVHQSDEPWRSSEEGLSGRPWAVSSERLRSFFAAEELPIPDSLRPTLDKITSPWGDAPLGRHSGATSDRSIVSAPNRAITRKLVDRPSPYLGHGSRGQYATLLLAALPPIR